MTAESPRLRAVIDNARELIDIAEQHGAHGMSVCGSVALGQDRDEVEGVQGSDIDFYAREFRGGDDARERAENLVKAYAAVLKPFAVDIRAWPELPGFLLDDHDRYKRGAIPLSTFLD